MATALKTKSVRDQVTAEEWQLRTDLAAAYRLVAMYGWDDLIFTHLSVRVPGPEPMYRFPRTPGALARARVRLYFLRSKARATAIAICCCCGRYSKLLARDRMPFDEKMASTCATRSLPVSAGCCSMMLITALLLPLDHFLRGLGLGDGIGGQDAAPARRGIDDGMTTDDAARVQHGIATDLGMVAEESAELAQAGVHFLAFDLHGHVAGQGLHVG